MTESLPSCKNMINRASFRPDQSNKIKLRDGTVHDLPSGTKTVFTQHRLCGDYYCLIESRKAAVGIGDTVDAAFLNALQLAA